MRILPFAPYGRTASVFPNKKSLFKIFLTLSMLVWGFTTWAQTLDITIDEHHFQIDNSNDLVVCHLDDISTYTGLQSFNRINIIFNGLSYRFTSVPNRLDYMNSYEIKKGPDRKTLYFTKLPLVSITTTNTIIDEPKVAANFVYADDTQVVTSDVGIELRGGSSQAFPKKTYDLEFWTDPSGADTEKYQFGDMREDDDWILDGIYNEPLRLRAHFSHKLWLDIHTPYYQADEPEAKSGADVEYVEVFLNGSYNGLYNLSEQVDKKQLKLKSFKDGEIRGELYKGEAWGPTTQFSALTTYDNSIREWGGYEYKLPDDDDVTDWSNLSDFTDFAVNSSNVDFTTNVWDRFKESNYEDYFIFLNLLRATDNFGKNAYLAKYTTGEPYLYVPWDLDGVLGTLFDGTNQNITNDILSNHFMRRVTDLDPSDHQASISQRWWDLRAGVLSDASLIGGITDLYTDLSETKVYERESIVYSNYSYGQGDLDYMTTWLENRLAYLDGYFTLPNQADCPDLSISASELQVGVVDGDCNNPGSITRPAGTCAPGSTMEFSTSGGRFWSFDLPEYNPFESMTILARCLCDDDPKFNSVSGSASTNPDCAPSSLCPSFANISSASLEVGVTRKNCNQQGDLHPPSGACPDGSTMLFSIDGGVNWSDGLPDYNQEQSITIETRCECIVDPSISSISGFVTTTPEDCIPDCPQLNNIQRSSLEVGVTPKTCDQRGDIHPPSGTCPEGSSMYFSIDGGANWTERLPDYDQDQSMTIRTRCECNRNPNITSQSASVTTNPDCTPSNDCPDFDNIQAGSLEVGVTPKTCSQNGDIHPPVGNCPSGSRMVFTIDGGQSWTERLPDYDQNETMTIETRCECMDDPSIISLSGFVTTNPICDASSQCPDFDIASAMLEVGVTPKTCNQNGDIHPPVGDCPSGSTMVFTIDGGQNWTERLPDYNQNQSITIQTTCICNIDQQINSQSGYVTTNPANCDQASSDLDLENRTNGSDLQRPIVKVYPNPTTDILTIDVSGVLTSKMDIVLTDMMGRAILSFRNLDIEAKSSFQKSISLESLPKGIYLLRSWIDGVQEVHKISVID